MFYPNEIFKEFSCCTLTNFCKKKVIYILIMRIFLNQITSFSGFSDSYFSLKLLFEKFRIDNSLKPGQLVNPLIVNHFNSENLIKILKFKP